MSNHTIIEKGKKVRFPILFHNLFFFDYGTVILILVSKIISSSERIYFAKKNFIRLIKQAHAPILRTNENFWRGSEELRAPGICAHI